VLWLMIGFYFLAGINHFLKPEIYIGIIPPYLTCPSALNILAGIFEIVFALLLYWVKTRKYAAFGIILMLFAFMPVHIFMIQKANVSPFLLGRYTISPIIALLRIPLQAIFIGWAWWCSKMKFNLLAYD
jgi:uncharacterized membrane protein